MITLRNKLYESLLDDEEDLMNSVDDRTVILNDKSSDFYKYFKTTNNWGQDIDEIPDINKKDLIYKNRLDIKSGHEPLLSYIPDITGIKANFIYINNSEDSKTLCKNIKTNRLNIYTDDNNVELKDLNIKITNNDIGIYISSDNYSEPVIFNNVNISSNKECKIYVFGGLYLPQFINTNVKCKRLILSLSNSYTDSYKSLINDINKYFDTNYTLDITNLKTGEVKQKNKLTIKSIRPIVNNFVNKINQPITKFKDGTKITDIFKDIPSNTDMIHIYLDNGVEIVFDKIGEHLSNFKINEFIVPLSDGWFMQIFSNRVINAKYLGKTNWGTDLRKK